MFDKKLVTGMLTQILDASEKVLERFKAINDPEDFKSSPEGQEKLDAICMLIIAIGESLKKVDKITDNNLLSGYPEIDWKGAKGMRDIISHQYFDIDAEEIFWVCSNRFKPLTETIRKIITDLS